MTIWDGLRNYLPSEWLAALAALPGEVAKRVQEVRLRAGQPLTVSLPEGERYVCAGGVTALRQQNLFICTSQQVEACFLRFCDHAVYAHEWELRQGYLSVSGGIRVGVAGRAVMHGDEIASIQAVTALCIRLPRFIRGCADWLRDFVTAPGYPISTLLVGEPSSGKTTLLRDLAAGLAANHRRVVVVDERGELSGTEGLAGCDVLLGYPKAEGVQQAVRCLAPEVVLFDELGSEAEAAAVAACAYAGVAVVATLHGRTPQEMAWRPLSRLLLEQRAFARWAFLSGRGNPGRQSGVYQPEVMENGVDWLPADFDSRHRGGDVRLPSSAAAGAVFTADQTANANSVTADELYRSSHERTMATVGGDACFF